VKYFSIELGCSVLISAIQFCSFRFLVKWKRGGGTGRQTRRQRRIQRLSRDAVANTCMILVMVIGLAL